MSVHEQDGIISTDEDGTPVVKTEALVQTEIPVYGSGKLGVYYPTNDGLTAYEITDHLGNVRALVREDVGTYVATLEDNGLAEYTNPPRPGNGFFQ